MLSVFGTVVPPTVPTRVLVCSVAITIISYSEWLKQWDFFIHSSGGWEVQDQLIQFPCLWMSTVSLHGRETEIDRSGFSSFLCKETRPMGWVSGKLYVPKPRAACTPWNFIFLTTQWCSLRKRNDVHVISRVTEVQEGLLEICPSSYGHRW